MANLQKKSFWQQYGNLILILSGILIGALIGVVAPNFGTTINPSATSSSTCCSRSWSPWCSCPSPPPWAAWPI